MHYIIYTIIKERIVSVSKVQITEKFIVKLWIFSYSLV